MSDEQDHRDSEISHIYKEGGWPEARRQIDEAILAASRRAVHRKHSFVRRWSPPFALAATVVLSFTLFLRVTEEKPDALVSPPSRAPQLASPVEGSRSADTAKLEAARSTSAPKPQAAPQAAQSVAARESASASRPASPPTPRQSSTPSPKPPPAERGAPAARTAPVLQPAPGASALKKQAATGARADRPERAPETRTQEQRALESLPARDAQSEAPAPALSAPPRAGEPFAQQPAAGAVSGASAAPDSAAGIVIQRSTPERSPPSWLEDIRRLKAQGRAEQAGRELAEFRKRYPDYPLPEDLR